MLPRSPVRAYQRTRIDGSAEVLRIAPNFSIERRRHILPFKNPDDFERRVEGMRKAGLPSIARHAEGHCFVPVSLLLRSTVYATAARFADGEYPVREIFQGQTSLRTNGLQGDGRLPSDPRRRKSPPIRQKAPLIPEGIGKGPVPETMSFTRQLFGCRRGEI